MFLRYRKYRMNEVFQNFDRVVLSMVKFPKLVPGREFDFKPFLKLSTDSFQLTLKNRDAEGRRIILFRVAKWNPKICSEFDAVKAQIHAITLAMYEEETQIAGMKFIVDFAGATTKNYFSQSTIIELVNFFNEGASSRLGGIYVLNVPPVERFFIETILAIVKKKDWIFILKENDILKEHFDPAILPKEYGGNCEFEDAVEDFSQLHEKYIGNVERFRDIKIDMSKASESELCKDLGGEGVGSFRKLEVD
jgi:alpha-tocopherol transfer protein